jgi:HK97 family phage major capsid protein
MPVDPRLLSPDRHDFRESRSWWIEQRDAARDTIRELLHRSEAITNAANGRHLTRSQQHDFDQIDEQLRQYGDTMQIIENELDSLDPDRRPQPDHRLAPIPSDYRAPDSMTRAAVLAPEQRAADYVRQRGMVEPNTDNLSLGKLVRGWVTGQWAGADAERRAMAEGTNSAGGYLVPTVLAATVIDLARNEARVMQAGARTVPMESETQLVPRQITDPAVAWRLENAAINQSGPTFDLITMTARSLACVSVLSRELLEDATVDLEHLVESSIAKATALEIDRVALRGSGTAPEPRGLLNTTGVTVTSLGANGAAATWDDVSTAVQTVRGFNFEPNAMIDAPRTEGSLARQKDSQGRYLQPPADLVDLKRLPTNQIPTDLTQGTSSTASEAYVGQWDQLLVGLRTQLVLTVLTERYADLGQIGIVSWWRGDIAVAHPQAFDILTGVL